MIHHSQKKKIQNLETGKLLKNSYVNFQVNVQMTFKLYTFDTIHTLLFLFRVHYPSLLKFYPPSAQKSGARRKISL